MEIPDSCDGKPFVFRNLGQGAPAIYITAIVNKGDRSMFVNLQVFAGKIMLRIHLNGVLCYINF